jgi:hypothetical protein
MALTDILFLAGDDQSIILEIPSGSTITIPNDILISNEFLYKLILEQTGGSIPYFAFIG